MSSAQGTLQDNSKSILSLKPLFRCNMSVFLKAINQNTVTKSGALKTQLFSAISV